MKKNFSLLLYKCHTAIMHLHGTIVEMQELQKQRDYLLFVHFGTSPPTAEQSFVCQ